MEIKEVKEGYDYGTVTHGQFHIMVRNFNGNAEETNRILHVLASSLRLAATLGIIDKEDIRVVNRTTDSPSQPAQSES